MQRWKDFDRRHRRSKEVTEIDWLNLEMECLRIADDDAFRPDHFLEVIGITSRR